MNFNKVYENTKNLNILYVEDNLDFREETSEVLEKLFNKVDIASDGKEGLKKYLSHYKDSSKYYDVVITDVVMPNMDGIELVKEIYKQNAKQPVIIISAHNESEYLLEFVNIGIEQFLVKPLDINMVLNVLYNISNKILISSTDKTDLKIIEFKNNYFWDKENSLLFYKKQNQQFNIKLTKKEILLMQIFIKNNSGITTLEEIFNSLWSEEPHLASAEALNPIISRFRKKIPHLIIQSIYGLGYKLLF